jgi:hypothetical protein
VRFPSAALALLALVGCYEQPTVPRDKPLSCASADEAECPTGYVCIANRVCAPRMCASDLECPAGLACARGACALVATGDGGADAGDGPTTLDAFTSAITDAGVNDDLAALPDAATLDVATTFDTNGAGS